VSQKHHVRTVEIRTVTATCDECGKRSDTCSDATRIGRGWQLVARSARRVDRDLCPDCVEVAHGLARAVAENVARAKHIAALESGDPIYVHGRVIIDDDVLYTRADIDAEIARAMKQARRDRA
jgi:hypothetical protein